MKLFFIVENDQPHASGGGYYALYKFGEFLARQGHEVCIYGVHDMGWVKPAANLRLRFRPSLPRRGLLAKADRRLSRLCGSLLLAPLVRRFRPDWILGVLTHSAVKAEALGRRYRIPVANFVYECPPWLEEVVEPEKYRAGYAHVGELWERTRAAYLGSRVLFPNSELSRSYNMRWLDGKPVAEPIHPGVDPDLMPASPAPEGEPLPLDPGSRHLLYVGRMAEGKNVGDLIAAFRRLPHAAELHLCGAGPELERLRKLADGSPRIRFHGYLPDHLLWSLFRQCDMVVYPTSFEGFGMPPMQALYFGKPCVASELPVFRSVFGDRLEYFPAGDVDALAATLDRLLGDPGYRRRRGEAGRRFVLENFTWERAAELIEKNLQHAGA